MEGLSARLQRKDVRLRLALMLGSLVLGLILANAAASALAVWRLDAGALVPGPWNTLFDITRASARSDMWSLLSVGVLGGAALACLVFFVERTLRVVWAWMQDATR